MRRWSYGINSYYRKASIYVEEGCCVFFILRWIVEKICDLIPSIPLPKISMKLWDKDDIEFNDNCKWTNLKEWYGNLAGFFCIVVHCPIDRFCCKHIKFTSVRVDYNELKEAVYYKDKKFWNDGEGN